MFSPSSHIIDVDKQLQGMNKVYSVGPITHMKTVFAKLAT